MSMMKTTTTIMTTTATTKTMIMRPPYDQHTNQDPKSSFSSPTDQPAATLGIKMIKLLKKIVIMLTRKPSSTLDNHDEDDDNHNVDNDDVDEDDDNDNAQPDSTLQCSALVEITRMIMLAKIMLMLTKIMIILTKKS